MKKNTNPGKFIVFEGIDGSGKTTQAKLLAERMAKESLPLFVTREPTKESIFGRLVRFIYTSKDLAVLPHELKKFFESSTYQFFRSNITAGATEDVKRFERIACEIRHDDMRRLPMFLQLGMIFDRFEHRIEEEIPQLIQGTHVVSDRDFFSTLAYSAGDDLSWPDLLDAHKRILGDSFIVPDLIILVEVPVRIGIERTLAKQGGHRDYFDTEERLSKIAQAYADISGNTLFTDLIRIARIDGTDDPEEVHAQVWPIVRNLASKKPNR